MNKRGFEVQFNWVFALIAGAAIIGLAVFFVSKSRDISQSQFDAQSLKTVDAIITGTGVSSDVTKISDIGSNLVIGCNRIAIGSAPRNYQNIVLFGPGTIVSGKLITMTLPYLLPFKVSNMLYATSPKIRYIIAGKSDLTKKINSSLPDSMQVEIAKDLAAASVVRNLNNYKIRLITDQKEGFGSFIVPKSLEKMPDFDVSLALIDGDLNSGTIQFFQKKGMVWEPKGASNYIGLSGILAAVFSETKENYDCSMKSLDARAKILMDVYNQRTKKLIQLTTDLDCKSLYTEAASQINLVLGKSILTNSEQISTFAENWKIKNEELELLSCPSLY